MLTVWRRQARLERREGISSGAFAAVRVDDRTVAAANVETQTVGELASRKTGVTERGVSILAAERIEVVIAEATVRVPTDVDARTLARVPTALRSMR